VYTTILAWTYHQQAFSEVHRCSFPEKERESRFAHINDMMISEAMSRSTATIANIITPYYIIKTARPHLLYSVAEALHVRQDLFVPILLRLAFFRKNESPASYTIYIMQTSRSNIL
jgi:hypothetical protein